jgi:hypothetical protein
MNELVSKLTNIEAKIRHLEQQYKAVDPFLTVSDPNVIRAKADTLVHIDRLKDDAEVLRKAMKILAE